MTATLICLHARQSGRLSFNAAGLLDAHMVCDVCGSRLRHLPGHAAEARAQSMLPGGGPAIAAA